MRRVLASIGAITTALAMATAIDALGRGWIRSVALEVTLSTALGAAQSAGWLQLIAKRGMFRRAGVGGLLAGALAFVLARSNVGWLDLGPIAAGSPGELALVVFPVTSAFALVGALAITPRAASSGRR